MRQREGLPASFWKLRPGARALVKQQGGGQEVPPTPARSHRASPWALHQSRLWPKQGHLPTDPVRYKRETEARSGRWSGRLCGRGVWAAGLDESLFAN